MIVLIFVFIRLAFVLGKLETCIALEASMDWR